MNINTNFSNFKKKHKKGINQIIFNKTSCKTNRVIENLISKLLIKKNSFIFESVEKRRIRGRYTIIGSNPDKIWEFNENKIYLYENERKKIIKGSPYVFLKKLIENFDFPTPKNIPQICSLLVGYFSYDIIRYIEKIPNKCVDDLKIPDIRLLRPKNIIIHDNFKKKIYFIVNCFADEKIKNYTKYYLKQINENKTNDSIIVVQIAGLIARRIVTQVEKTQTVTQGQRLGMIRFGSRVDLYYNQRKTMVKLGQNVIAGESLIASS